MTFNPEFFAELDAVIVTVAIEPMLLVPRPHFAHNDGEDANLFGYLLRCSAFTDDANRIEHWPLKASQKEEA